MPVVQIELQFDDKGAVTGARKVSAVTEALDSAKKAASEMTASIDVAWKTLGARPTSVIASEMKGLVAAFREVKGNANSTAQDVSRAYDAMREKMRSLSSEAKSSVKFSQETSESFSQAAEKINVFGTTMKKLAGVAAGIFAVNKIKDAALHAFDLAAKYETLGVVVQQVGKVSGYSAVEIDKNVSALRRMGIAGIEARQTMTQLLQAQVDITKTPALARIAQDAAVIGGTNSSEVFERLVHGIQSAQTDVLRTIGISVNFEQAYDKMAKQVGKTTAELTEQEKTQARVNAVMEAGQRIAGAYEAAMGTVGKQISSLSRIHQDFFTDFGGFLTTLSTETGAVEKYSGIIETLNAEILIFTGLMAGISHEDLLAAFFQGGQALRDLVQGFKSSKTESEAFKTSIVAVSGTLGSINTAWFMTQLAQLDDDLKNKVLTVDQYRRSLNDLRVLMNAQLNQPAENAPKTGGFGVKGEVASLRESYKESTSGKREAEIKKIRDEQEKLRLYKNEFSSEEYSKLSKSLEDRLKSLNSASDSAASKAENAAEKWKQFGLEIDALNGKGTKTAVTLEKQNKEIEDTGKAAGKSATEIQQMKDSYASAFQTNTLKDFNKHIVELEGNAVAIRDLKIEEEVRKWSASFKEFVDTNKMSTEEAAANIERLKAALAKQSEVQDAQTSLSFIKEYSQLSGDYSQNQKYLLEMLDAEEKIYRDKLPVALQPFIEKWKELKKLQEARDPLSGSIRGLRSYSNEAMNLAKGIESAWTNGFQGMEDALVKFTMSGKLSFSDMANSIISDLMRIAIRSSITGPLASGLGSLMGDMFGSWTTSSATSGAVDNAIGWVSKSAHGNVFSGSGISSHSNSVVTGPTLFNFNSMAGTGTPPALRPFGKGAGLMGEAGWEAVMPLTRNSHGDLSVNAVGMGNQIARDVTAAVMARGGGGTGAAPQTTVNIFNNTAEPVSQRTRTDNMGNKNISVFIGDVAAQQTLTPGSTLDKANRARLGIQPQATRR